MLRPLCNSNQFHNYEDGKSRASEQIDQGKYTRKKVESILHNLTYIQIKTH
ncbi:hypothetical protein ERICII_04140 (plasmid) [Paenibacillus larvae subsp. larvae DSM 25430]|nr:hypothetical protein ERICII_04140 [Paenibacillus larvae subsp. larvae DSM 25430]